MRNAGVERGAWAVGLRTVLIGVIALGAPLLAGHQMAQPAYADGTITVTSAADNETQDNELTLREALRLATEGLDGGIHTLTVAELAACGAGCGGAYLPGPVSDDTIVFGGNYTISVDCGGLGVLPSLSDDDADSVGDTIDGSGRTVTIKPNGACAVVGLDLSGDGNTVRGVRITDSSEDGAGSGFTIGIRVSGDFNLVDNGTGGEACQVGGAETDGINISGSDNTVRDCFIGTSATGGAPAVPNGDDGVDIAGGDNNAIGVDGGGNVIAGNGPGPNAEGILVKDGALSTFIIDNMIGVDVEGDTALPNSGDGIDINDGFATIGQGATAAQTNVIGGNGASGVRLGLNTSDASIRDNYIGTNAANSTTIGNTLHGVEIVQASGAVNVEDNTIGNNGGSGVLLDGDDDGHLVDDNFIGTNAAGTADLGNGTNGVLVQLDAGTDSTISDNLIRFNGTAAGDGGINVQSGGSATISGNTVRSQAGGGPGVLLAGGTTNNLSLNTIGGSGFGNGGGGIVVTGGTTNNLSTDTITFNSNYGILINGGSTTNVGPGDTISNNFGHGIEIESACAAGCDVNVGITTGGGADNTIAENGNTGININGGEDIDIGTSAAGGDNDILSNTQSGIKINGGVTVEVRENTIDDNNTPDLGIEGGIIISNGTGILIGGIGDGNTISDNGGANILVALNGATIQGNEISTASSPNIEVTSGTAVLIGGTTAGQGNIIRDATGGAIGDGVAVPAAGADSVLILGNTFEGNGGQSIDLDSNGIDCTDPASNGGIDCPVITVASSDAETVSGTYNLGDCPNPCRIEVYQVTTDNETNGEGNVFWEAVAATGGTFTVDLTGDYDIETGDLFTATASTNLRTSEFGMNSAAVPTLGTYLIDWIYLISQAAKNAAGSGDNLYGAQDSGAGGQNNKIKDGPTFKRPKGANPPITYSFAATVKNTTTYIRIQNDGTFNDQAVYDTGPMPCTRSTGAAPIDCTGQAGLTFEVLGMDPGETTAVMAPGAFVTGDILITISSAVPIGDYVVIVNLHSQGDITVYESVTLRFKIK